MREPVGRRPGADRVLVLERVVEPPRLVRQGGLEGSAQGREGVADHQHALPAVPLAGEDHRLQGAQRPRLRLVAHQLGLGEREVVEPEVGQQPRAVERRVGRPGLLAPAPRRPQRRGRLAAQPGLGVAAVEVGGVGLGDLVVDLLRPLPLAQERRRPAPSSSGRGGRSSPRDRASRARSRCRSPRCSSPCRTPASPSARGWSRRWCPWDRSGAAGAGSRWRGRTARRSGSRRRATSGPWPPARGRRRSGPPSPGTAGRAGGAAGARPSRGSPGRAGRWRRRRRPGRGPRPGPRPAGARRPRGRRAGRGRRCRGGGGSGSRPPGAASRGRGRRAATESSVARALASSFRSSRARARRLSWSPVSTPRPGEDAVRAAEELDHLELGGLEGEVDEQAAGGLGLRLAVAGLDADLPGERLELRRLVAAQLLAARGPDQVEGPLRSPRCQAIVAALSRARGRSAEPG